VEARNAWFEANSDQLNDNGERLIIKDNLDSQIYGPNVNMSDAYGVTDWYVPEGNTDGLQAVDDGAGNGVKVEINNMFEDWLDIDENQDKWTDGKFSASEKRILIQNWTAKAFAIYFQKYRTLHRHMERVGNFLGPNGEGADRIKPGNDTSYVLGTVRPPIIPEAERSKSSRRNARRYVSKIEKNEKCKKLCVTIN
tara:strand:- start:1776 stop:2363 length:588 start_codon:yes stop_codon:yes gene_type:complete